MDHDVKKWIRLIDLNSARRLIQDKRREKLDKCTVLKYCFSRSPLDLLLAQVFGYWRSLYSSALIQRAFRFLAGFPILVTFSLPNGGRLQARWGTSDIELIRELVWNHEYDRILSANPGETVVDVGANIGLYSIACSHKVGNSGKIIAIEPEKENFSLLVQNLRLNGVTNVLPINEAISNFIGTTDLFLSETNLGGHSIIFRRGSKKRTVNCETLDKLCRRLGIRRVHLIKVDVEGAELAVLEGAQKMLEENKLRLIVVAEHFKDQITQVSRFLSDLGFITKVVNNYVVAWRK